MKKLMEALLSSPEDFLILVKKSKHKIPKLRDLQSQNNILHIVLSLSAETISPIISDSRFKSVITKEMLTQVNTSGFTPLHLAANVGHVEAVKFLLEIKADPNVRTKGGASPLMVAAALGHYKVINTLVERKADPYLPDDEGAIPLHKAAAFNRFLALNALLLIAPNTIDRQQHNGYSALHWAAMVDNEGTVVQFLIKKKANVNLLTPKDGVSPFMYAASFNKVAAAKSLWESKADPYILNPNHWSATSLAISCGHKEFLEFLKNSEILAPDIISKLDPREPLPTHVAVSHSQPEILQFLLESNPKMINLPDQLSETALHATTINTVENPLITGFLLEYKANPNLQETLGNTPLMQACENGHKQVVDLMLTASKIKCDLTISNHQGLTAFYWAASSGNVHIGRSLLNAGDLSAGKIRVRKQSQSDDSQFNETKKLLKLEKKETILTKLTPKVKDADTPFHAAVRNSHFDFVKLLLERKAVDTDLPDSRGDTPLFISLNEGSDDITLLLINHKADINYNFGDNLRPLHIAVYRKRTVLLPKILDQKDLEMNVCSDQISAPLCLAAEIGDEKAVRILIAKKADLNLGYKDTTPLYHATEQSRALIVKLLIDAKADPTKGCTADEIIPLQLILYKIARKNPDEVISQNDWETLQHLIKLNPNMPLTVAGDTALHLSARINKPLWVQKLLEYSVDVNAQTILEKETPLHIAAAAGYVEIVKLLIQFKAGLNLQLSSIGATPLHLAVNFNFLNIVESMVAAKADLTIRMVTGHTPLLLAEEKKYNLIVELLSSQNLVSLEKSKDKKEAKKKLKTHGQPYKNKKCLVNTKFDFGEYGTYREVIHDHKETGIRRLKKHGLNTEWFILVTSRALSEIKAAGTIISDVVLRQLSEPILVPHSKGHQQIGFIRGNERLKGKDIYLKLTLASLTELRLFSTKIIEVQGKILFILDHFEKLHGRTTSAKFSLTKSQFSFISSMASIDKRLDIVESTLTNCSQRRF